jgi:membrane fusion protein (multidrug efflux system)
MWALVARTTIVAVTLAGALACNGGGASPSWAADKKGGAPDTTMRVAVTAVQPRRIERHYATSGTLRALRATDVVAPQAAIVEAILVEEGDVVKAGDPLARLDGRSMTLAANQAGVQLENLERQLERLESVQGGAISKEEIDTQRAAVAEARAAVKLSRHQVKLTTVRAPFAGTITARLVDIGTLATSATVLFSLADVTTLLLDLHVPELDAATVKSNAQVDLTLVDGTKFTAEVIRRAPIVDAATGTVKFTVRASDFPRHAAPGAFARARVLVDAREAAPSLPRSAVFELEGKPHVYVIEDGKARRRPVELGLTGEDAVEIVAGIGKDDVVVQDGNAGITEGMPLAAAEPEANGG